jgi:hypothetical protein
MLAAEVPQPAPTIETSQSTSDSQTSQPEARPGTPQTTGSIQALKPQAALAASRATGSVHSGDPQGAQAGAKDRAASACFGYLCGTIAEHRLRLRHSGSIKNAPDPPTIQ